MKKWQRLSALFLIWTVMVSVTCSTCFATAQGSSDITPPAQEQPGTEKPQEPQEPESTPAQPSSKPAPSSSSSQAPAVVVSQPASSKPVQQSSASSSSKPASSKPRRTKPVQTKPTSSQESSSSQLAGDFWNGVSSESIQLPSVGAISDAGQLIESGVDVTKDNKSSMIGIVSWICIAIGVVLVLVVLFSTTRRPPRSGPGRKRYRKLPRRPRKKKLLNDKYYRNFKY